MSVCQAGTCYRQGMELKRVEHLIKRQREKSDICAVVSTVTIVVAIIFLICALFFERAGLDELVQVAAVGAIVFFFGSVSMLCEFGFIDNRIQAYERKRKRILRFSPCLATNSIQWPLA